MPKNYFNLASENDISKLSIKKIDNFNCSLVDDKDTIYDGFKLAESEKGNVLIFCDVGFQKSGTDKKYQPRLVFRKTDQNLQDKTVRQNAKCIRIPFYTGEEGYREFWKMIAFLYKWREEIDLGEFEDFFAITKRGLAEILPKVANLQNKETVLDSLEKLSNNDLQSIDNLVNTAKLKNILNEWEGNKTNDNEDFWQKKFQDNPWILSQIFSCPFVLIGKKFYCGGKEDDDKGGVKGDLLYKNGLTGNLAFIEIKTPKKEIVGSEYRGQEEGKENLIYSMDKEVTGGVNQVLNQKKVYLKTHGEKDGKFFDNAKSVLVIGTTPQNEDKRKSFELYRNSLRDVEVITFDELFGRANSILKIFEK